MKNYTKQLLKNNLIKEKGGDMGDMQLIRTFRKGFTFFSCVIDICSKYAWVIPLKDKKEITITNAF